MLQKFIGIIMILAVSACATPYVATPYEHGAAPIKKVVLVDDAVPEKLSAWEVASVGSNFGLIGALTDAGIQASREDALMAALATVQFDAEAKLESRVVSALGAKGYEVAVLENGVREKRVFLKTYPGAPEGSEAYLDLVVTNYGYISSGAFQPWRPTVEATVRLVSVADSSKTLMENQISYNGMYPKTGVITLSANPAYAFQNRDDMVADPAKLAAGLEDAFNQVADTAATLLQ